MSDYIKRDDAIKAFDPEQRRDWYTPWLWYTPWIVEELKDLPSADVAPIRQGRWKKEYGHYKCLLCNGLDDFADNYCPNCGARMDGENDE